MEVEPVVVHRPEIISEYGPWMRRFLLVIAVINMLLTLALINGISTLDDLGEGNRAILCSLAVDDARDDVSVKVVYEEHCDP